MTYVDRQIGNASTVHIRYHLDALFSSAAAVGKFLGEAHSACSSLLAFISHAQGPTHSASALVYGGVAAAGTVLYEAWDDAAEEGRPTRGLICERGCLRRLSKRLHVKATDEIRLHQDVLDRRFRYRVRTLRSQRSANF